MANRDKAPEETIARFVAAHPGWAVDEGALTKTFSFERYARVIAFVVALGFAAEKRDHHPDLVVKWGSVRVAWRTHDAGGITAVDFEMAEATDTLIER